MRVDLTDLLHQSPSARVHRGTLREDGSSVVVKLPAPGAPRDAAETKLRYEARMLRAVEASFCPQVPRPLGLIDLDGAPALIMTDLGGTSLATLLPTLVGKQDEVLLIAMQVARALERVHQARIVHKDVNPNNIIYNRGAGTVQLIDFGIASQLTHETQIAETLRSLEGTPHYIAPEQTGRTQRVLDYRADFYSLGATLYQLLAGHPPFVQTDLTELVYAVLTALPTPLNEVAPQLPQPLCDLIMRLLRKSPDERYQSAFGLLADLERCDDMLRTHGHIAPFAIGQQDRVERFEVPRDLYGREHEIEQLQEAFVRCCATRRAVIALISGPSGIGKSSLMQELQPALLRHRCLYAAGKHDPLRRHIPFSAFSDAIAMLVRQILREPDDLVELWRRRLHACLGNNGQTMLDVAPALELLVGPQKPAAALGPREHENRLLFMLQRFVQALCSQQPLVLFLDDLQWADSATLKLVGLLTQPHDAGAGLMLVGAYRSNEVDAAHPLAHVVRTLQQEGSLESLQVGPFTLDDLTALLTDCTAAPEAAARELAVWLLRRTDGNPFFVHELLKALWQQRLIEFSTKDGHFAWSMPALERAATPDTLVHLLTDKIVAMGGPERGILSLAACIGDRFPLTLLCAASNWPREAVLEALQSGLQAGLIAPLTQGYRYAADSAQDVGYKFVHDRVRQAAYELLPPQQAQEAHHRVGRLLLSLHSAGQADVFGVLEHLNVARALLTEQADRRQLAELNVRAAREAKSSAAYAVSRQCLSIALELMPGDIATREPAFYSVIQQEMAENEYLDGALEAALQRLESALHGAFGLHRAQVQALRIFVLSALAKHQEALVACGDGLAALGTPIDLQTQRFPWITLLGCVLRTRSWDTQALRSAPPCAEARATMALQILGNIAEAVYHINAAAHLRTINAMLVLLARHGRAPQGALAFMSWASILATLNQYAEAERFADLAQALCDDGEAAQPGTVAFLAAGWLHYQRPRGEGSARCEQDFLRAREGGDLTFAGWCAIGAIFFSFHGPLEGCLEVHARYEAFLLGRQHPAQIMFGLAVRQAARCLLGRTLHDRCMGDDSATEAAFDAYVQATPRDPTTLMILMYRTQLHYLAGDHAAAWSSLDRVEAHAPDRKATDAMYADYSFYGALIAFQQARTLGARAAGGARTRRMLRKIRHLAAARGALYTGEWLLLRAEAAALAGHAAAADALYNEACARSGESGCLDRVGVAHECAAKHYLRRSLPLLALPYLQRAAEAFVRWGAASKAAQLHGELMALGVVPQPHAVPPRAAVSDAVPVTRTVSTRHATSELDLPALLRAAQAISREVQVDQVVQRILEGMQHGAGATRVALLQQRHGALAIAADTAGPAGSAAAPLALLRYVARTRQPLMLHSPKQSEIADPYLQTCDAKAVMAVPVLHQGTTQGIVYLENDVAADAFTPEILTLVEVLAAQAAIALDTAYAYSGLEREVAQRTAELRDAHKRLLLLEKESTEMRMAGGFAHEMRNALTGASYALTSLLSLFKEGGITFGNPDDAAMAAALTDSIRVGYDRAMQITTRILEYAQVTPELAANAHVQVDEVAARVLHDLGDRVQTHQIATHVQIDPALRIAMGDAHVYAILRHLIENAADALSQQDAAPRTLRVIGRADGPQPTVRVEDTGAPIPDSVQDQLFTPFYSTKGAQGVGLGLAFSRKLARAYGGDLLLESAAGGTAATFLLPASLLKPPPDHRG